MENTEQIVYDVDYFIKKFEAIPEELWCEGRFNKGVKCCAFGHCGIRDNSSISDDFKNKEFISLNYMFKNLGEAVPSINDGKDERFKQPTPKQRILAALNYIKEQQNK